MTNLVLTVTIAFFCHCKTCCQKQNGVTASGKKPVQGRTIAGPRSIPLGTTVSIPGFGTLTVEDRTARKWDGKRWDIYVTDHQRAKRLGIRKVKITIP